MIDTHASETATHQNITALNEILPDLLKTHFGMFALMHDGEVVQFCRSSQDATGRAKRRSARMIFPFSKFGIM